MLLQPRHQRSLALACAAVALLVLVNVSLVCAGKPRSVKDWAKLKDEDFDAVEGEWRHGDEEHVRCLLPRCFSCLVKLSQLFVGSAIMAGVQRQQCLIRVPRDLQFVVFSLSMSALAILCACVHLCRS